MKTLRGLATGFATVLLVGFVSGGASPSHGADDGAGTETDTETDYGRMLLLLDSSGSMAEPAAGGGSKIDAAKSALGEVIGALPDEAYVGLRVYGAKVFSRSDKGACKDTQLVVPPGVDNREELSAAVGDYTPYGETPIGFSLRQAAKDIGGEGKRSVVLVSDGVATCEPDPCDVARELSEQGIDLQIDVVGLSVDAEARTQLRCIAAAGRGTYYDADSADEIAESLTTASERAMRPFRYDGEPVRGGHDASTAMGVEAGAYVDKAGGPTENQERWYRYERKYDGSTVTVSTLELETGAYSRLFMDVMTEDGTPCPRGYYGFFFAIVTTDEATISGSDPEIDPGCRTGPLLIQVRSAHDEPHEFGLSILEEPPPTNLDDLPAGFDSTEPNGKTGAFWRGPRTSGAVVPVDAGATLSDATPLESGRKYSSTYVSGEVAVYKVHVGWGQSLSVRIGRSADTGAIDVVDDGVQLLTPQRVVVPEETEVRGDGSRRLLQGTLPVRWRTREGDVSPSYVAGDYYLLIDLGKNETEITEKPYTIEVEVQGDVTGVPEYADGETVLPVVVDESPEEPSDESTDQPAEEPSEDETTPTDDTEASEASVKRGLSTPVKLASAAGLGLVAIGCLVAGVLLLRRPRSAGRGGS